MVYTMVEMDKEHNLNIYKYLKYLLEQLPGMSMSDDEFAKLVPWNDEVQNVCSGAMQSETLAFLALYARNAINL